MKQLFIILFLIGSLDVFSQITFTGVKRSTSVVNNNDKTEVEKKQLETTDSYIEPKKEISQINERPIDPNGKVDIKIYDPEAEAKSREEQKRSSITVTIEPVETDIFTETKKDSIQKLNIAESKEITKPESINKEVETPLTTEEIEQTRKSNRNALSKIEKQEDNFIINEEPKVVSTIEKEAPKKTSGIFFEKAPEIEKVETTSTTKNEVSPPTKQYNLKTENPTIPVIEEEKVISKKEIIVDEPRIKIEKPEVVKSTEKVSTTPEPNLTTKTETPTYSINKTTEKEAPKKSRNIATKKIEKTEEIKTPEIAVSAEKTSNPEITANNSNNKITSEKEESKASNPKKGSWSIGLGVGLPIVIGDMNTRFGYGGSLTIQKALGHVFSLRFQAIMLETYGRDVKFYNNSYANYKTRFTDYTLQGVITLNNLNFYKKEPRVIYNLIAGGGLATRHSWIDRYDENASLYSYDGIPRSDVSETNKALNDLLDKNYETIVPKSENAMSIKNTNILPSIVLGAGISVKLSKVIDLNLETRMSYHFDDNLDAHQRGKYNDWMSFTSIGLTFKIPSKNESMLWTNPIYSKVEEIEELKKKVDEGNLLKDEDKDGIADIFDQDLNTPAKVAVDSRGVPSDMDKDGVPDYRDAEPFTIIDSPVDEFGIAIDADNDGIADVIDQETNTLPGKQVDTRGVTIKTVDDLANIKNNSDFELIFFDENSSKIKREFYSDLYKISKYITRDPTAKIQIIGHTDVLATERYNLNLSEKRANAVYSMLIELFKIPSKNLVTKYFGEEQPLIEGLPEIKDAKLEPAYYLNRRVEFKIMK